MLAIHPCTVALGAADVGGVLSAVASGYGAWAFAMDEPGTRKALSTVKLVEPSAELVRHRPTRPEPAEVGARKTARMSRKTEQSGNGHAMHARGAGKSSRSGRQSR